MRFGAFSLAAIRRILAAGPGPERRWTRLAELQRDLLDPRLRARTDRAPAHQRVPGLALTEESCDEVGEEEPPESSDDDQPLRPA